MNSYYILSCFVLMLVLLKSGRCKLDQCVRFETNSDTLNVQEHSTVRLDVSIQPQKCSSTQTDIGSVRAFVQRPFPPHVEICQLQYTDGKCIPGYSEGCTCQPWGFSVTTKIVDPVKEVWVIQGFGGNGTVKIAEKAVDIFVGGPSSAVTRFDAATDDVTESTTTTTTLIDDHSKHGSTPPSGAGEHAEDTDKEERPGPKEDNPSFTQTPAFAGFVIVGVVMAIILILLAVLLFRQKGIPALARRRARNSVAIPDDYEHPRGSHHYERPIFRGRQQPLPPPPPPPSNPVDDNRDSLLDPNYSVIDDQYEVPATTGVRRPTQAETAV